MFIGDLFRKQVKLIAGNLPHSDACFALRLPARMSGRAPVRGGCPTINLPPKLAVLICGAKNPFIRPTHQWSFPRMLPPERSAEFGNQSY
jgi:hypothetical protein